MAASLILAACSTPSQQYGLAPVEKTGDPYPNINMDPTQKPAEAMMTPEQRAEAEAELMRRAGKLPKR
ncbi:hypothetical protein [Terrihabitans soli]|uniref:hypothetical protein n=1 Tax=Terrihabitans soli TaxID=708113 RepID=UPI001CA33811|nr:hypothetical protein [Terrihabitans soli]